ncbi:hypothetical protein M433DRAFT_74706 [Acidomyces richmondensis BFW]|nr:MAG: hypothetical protein FE78DRAFT_139256 [Acidomyces sp. 'richmondensis']KYG42000.1 hypothetical protein M433DRAFT_74706 [Acidomyces richmondensis BFW]
MTQSWKAGKTFSRHSRNVEANHGKSTIKKNDAVTADDETISFIKRTLCSKPRRTGPSSTNIEEDALDKPLEQLLPPLTSDNAIDIQLYGIISVVINQFVQSWYHQISPDTEFVAEIVLIIAHCTRGIEERLRHLDLESLLLDELPGLLSDHIDAVEIARLSDCGSKSNFQISSIYHALRPHSALSPLPINETTAQAENENEIDWSQLLVSRIMPLVLPPEDLLNPCLNVLVSEIFSDMIIHKSVLGKISQPWLIWEGVTKAIYSLRSISQPTQGQETSPISRLDQYGLLSTEKNKKPESSSKQCMMVEAFRATDGAQSTAVDNIMIRPLVSMRIWSCIAKLVSLEQHMPWLAGMASLLQWLSLNGPGRVCRANSALDRLMSAHIREKLLNPAVLPSLLHAIRSAAMPGNVLAPSRIPPTSDEIAEIKRECARAIMELAPQPVRTHYFATTDTLKMQSEIARRLDLFADEYINKHLIVAVLELIVVRLFPELGQPGQSI